MDKAKNPASKAQEVLDVIEAYEQLEFLSEKYFNLRMEEILAEESDKRLVAKYEKLSDEFHEAALNILRKYAQRH